MKKFLTILLTLVMALALCGVFAGCGSEEAQEPAEETTAAATEAEEEYAADTSIYDAIDGEYMDKTSERASLMASSDLESDCMTIIVSWAQSADTSYEWTMHTTINEDNQLVYTDCVKKEIVYDEDGNVVSEDNLYKDGKGYFEYADGGELKWTGAQDEECVECVFVQIEG